MNFLLDHLVLNVRNSIVFLCLFIQPYEPTVGFEIARKTKPNRDETDRALELRFELAARGESAGLELNVFGFAAIPPIEHRWP
jgi:hypothetical protein